MISMGNILLTFVCIDVKREKNYLPEQSNSIMPSSRNEAKGIYFNSPLEIVLYTNKWLLSNSLEEFGDNSRDLDKMQLTN